MTSFDRTDVVSYAQPNQMTSEQILAAIDIGSNSFHLAVGRLDHGEVRTLLSLSEKVQLAGGFDDNDCLNLTVMERGLHCLRRFCGYLEGIKKDNIRIVATNALRKAQNSHEFTQSANAFLPVPIEVISGREEGRLIYLGVSHTNACQDKRLVIDIGGGSTEFIIGEGFSPIAIESLSMGCVAFTQKFFADGSITEDAFVNAINAAKHELFVIIKHYKKLGWSEVIGSSGTIKACRLAIIELGLGHHITAASLDKLKNHLVACGDGNQIRLVSVKAHRQGVFAAGVAILLAIMQSFEIETMNYSDGALREGVMYDMLGRQDHENVQQRSVLALGSRYLVSKKQATLVSQTCQALLDANPYFSDHERTLLLYAAQLHEVGLAVSHSDYHKHSSYLLKWSDMLGFSRADQEQLACLVLYQRRKLKSEQKALVALIGTNRLVQLCLLLRLSVLANQSRSRHRANIALTMAAKQWTVSVGAGNHQALLAHQLMADAAQFAKWGVSLQVVLSQKVL